MQFLKNILVISHERSGTHFLVNSIALNLGLNNRPDSILGDLRKKLLEKTTPKIFKSHHQFKFFEDFYKELDLNIIYIVRDGRDVLTSCFYYFNKTNISSFPVTKSVGELIRINPTEYAFDGVYSIKKSANMVQRWACHVEDWIKTGVYVVKYEDLNLKYEETMNKIFDKFEWKKRKFIRPSLKDFSVSPRKGVVGDHKKHMKKEDFLFYDYHAMKTMEKLGYENSVHNNT